jgi:thiol-disulfide isomerase/thioredoxin
LLDGGVWPERGGRGRVLLLNFWATWCEPCRTELPALLLAATAHARRGLVLLGVNHREAPATIRRFVQGRATGLQVLLDADGQIAKAWHINVFPSTVLIGRNGQPLGTWVGEIDAGAPVIRSRIVAALRST